MVGSSSSSASPVDKRKWWQAKSGTDEATKTMKKDGSNNGKSKGRQNRRFIDAMKRKAKRLSGARDDSGADWAHLKMCSIKECQTCKFATARIKWQAFLYINDKTGSWLGKVKNDNGDVLVGCKVCKKSLATNPNWKCPWSIFTIPVQKLRLSSLRSHMHSKKHKFAMSNFAIQCLHGSGDTSTSSASSPIHLAAPATEVFRDVWEKAGLHQDKIKRGPSEKMMWCLSEVLKANTRRFLEDADCIGLIRDERHGRLLIRYRAVKGLDLQCGVLGQAKNFGTGHENIGQATINLVRQALEANSGAPRASRHRLLSKPQQDELSQRLTKRTTAVLEKVEMLCVDSASDELLSGQVMRYGPQNDSTRNNGVTPNLKLVIRDATHAARRCSQKPEASDPFIAELNGTLFSSKDSITQRIHNSHHWTQVFKNYADDIDGKIGHQVSNLRAAKHRHESFTKPKCRFVLYFEAFITVGLHMVRKGGEYSKYGSAFLGYINEEVAVQAAMLADASCEGLQFIRKTDNEETDLSELNCALADYLLRLETLFVHEQCVAMVGYTNIMLHRLETPIQFRLQNAIKVLGGDDETWDRAGVINRCLQRMKAYTKIVMHVSKAEFPDFDICSSFQVFGRYVVQQAASVPDVTRLSEQARKQLAKLAIFFNVSEADLQHQYAQHVPFAKQHLLRCDVTTKMGDVWTTVLKNRLASNTGLFYVIARFLLYTASTARVEQNFSALKRVFNEHRLRLSNDTESRVAKLMLEMKSDTDPSKQHILQEAQKIYVLHFSANRSGYKTRIDKGVQKVADTTRNTEAAFTRRREKSLSAAVHQCSKGTSSNSVQAVQTRLESVDTGGAWTDKHDAMVGKQCEKIQQRMIAALLDHGDVCGQTTEELEQKVQEEHRARLKRAKEKQSKHRSIMAVTGRKTVTFQDARFCLDDAIRNDDVLNAVSRHPGCCVVDDLLQATHFVVKDLRKLGMRVTWLAKVMGGYILPPKTVVCGKGPVVAYKPAYLTHRMIWVTTDFQERHVTAFTILKKVFEHRRSKWKQLQTEEQFREQFSRCARTKRPAEVCVLKCKTETFNPALPAGSRCYDVTTFLQFARYDEAVSHIGASNR